jgi:hypothetical protein
MMRSHAAAGKCRGARNANAKGDAKSRKLIHAETPWREWNRGLAPVWLLAGRPAGGSDGISIAPALDTVTAVIILAAPLSCEALLGPKSLKRIPAVAPIATIAANIADLKSPRRSFL